MTTIAAIRGLTLKDHFGLNINPRDVAWPYYKDANSLNIGR